MEKRIYLGLAILGLILPYSQFISFLIENGVNTGLIIHEITAYRISSFAWLDVVLTAVTVIVLVFEEKGRMRNWWLPVVVSLIVGPSCGLPLMLYLRE